MASKFDDIRSGKIVEISGGRKARLNPETKMFETSDGRRIYVGDDEDFFPSSEESLKYSKEKENLKKQINRTPGGEFLFKFGDSGVLGGAKDWVNRITKGGDEYLRNKRAQQEVSQEISEESPYTSAAASVASFVPDIYLTRGMSAVKAAPLLTGLSAGSRIIDEPKQVAEEAALAAGVGFILDKGTGYIGKITQRRKMAREIPQQQQAVKAQNIAGKEAVDAENLLKKQNFNALQERIKNENEALLHHQNLTINERQNKMIQAQNAYEQKKAAKSASDAETIRLKKEYNQSIDEYKQAMKELPELQRKAQSEYSNNIVSNAKKIEEAFPRDSKVGSSQFGVDDFLDETVRNAGLGGTAEGARASKIIKSIFQEGEQFSAREISKKYKALEEAIKRSEPEVQRILSEFKTHMGERLSPILADSLAYTRVIPSLQKQLRNDLQSSIRSLSLPKSGLGSEAQVLAKAENSLNSIFQHTTPEDFIRKLESGEFAEYIKNNVISSADFKTNVIPEQLLKKTKKQGLDAFIEKFGPHNLNIQDPYRDTVNKFSQEFSSRVDRSIAKAQLKSIASDVDASRKLGKKAAGTYGLSPDVPEPVMPSAPNPVSIPPELHLPPAPPQALPLPPKPSLNREPIQPMPQSFSPIAEPTLAPAANSAEHLGDLLEKSPLAGGGKMNNLLKLGALKYALGTGALPAAGVAGGIVGAGKLLTSPTAIGNTARASFKQLGIQAIEAMAQKYPSYHNGVLENPQERRSLTKEIENDFEIPLEDKAMLQSKINRGKPIGERLQ